MMRSRVLRHKVDEGFFCSSDPRLQKLVALTPRFSARLPNDHLAVRSAIVLTIVKVPIKTLTKLTGILMTCNMSEIARSLSAVASYVRLGQSDSSDHITKLT